MLLPTLQLVLQLAPTDRFGSLEWVLANARRTGLSLRHLHVDTERGAGVVRLGCEAPMIELLELFVRRVAQGVDVALIDAEFSDVPDTADEPEALVA